MFKDKCISWLTSTCYLNGSISASISVCSRPQSELDLKFNSYSPTGEEILNDFYAKLI